MIGVGHCCSVIYTRNKIIEVISYDQSSRRDKNIFVPFKQFNVIIAPFFSKGEYAMTANQVEYF